jgi:hypothetical protein
MSEWRHPDWFTHDLDPSGHLRCLDCIHFQTAGQPNRRCELRPKEHIYMGVEPELDGLGEPIDLPDGTRGWKYATKTRADTCPDFSLSPHTLPEGDIVLTQEEPCGRPA